MPATGLNRYLPDWSATAAPAAAAQATATRPASTGPALVGGTHVATSVSATLVSGGTTAQVQLNLINGVSGGAAILGSWILSVPAVAGTCIVFSLDSLEIIGTPNTAMTLEFAAGAGAGNFESVTLTGHTL
jgi:hypothetical protein